MYSIKLINDNHGIFFIIDMYKLLLHLILQSHHMENLKSLKVLWDPKYPNEVSQ